MFQGDSPGKSTGFRLTVEVVSGKIRRFLFPYLAIATAAGGGAQVQFFAEGFPSGQRDQTVNLTALPSVVRIHPPPPFAWLKSREWDRASRAAIDVTRDGLREGLR